MKIFNKVFSSVKALVKKMVYSRYLQKNVRFDVKESIKKQLETAVSNGFQYTKEQFVNITTVTQVVNLIIYSQMKGLYVSPTESSFISGDVNKRYHSIIAFFLELKSRVLYMEASDTIKEIIIRFFGFVAPERELTQELIDYIYAGSKYTAQELVMTNKVETKFKYHSKEARRFKTLIESVKLKIRYGREAVKFKGYFTDVNNKELYLKFSIALSIGDKQLGNYEDILVPAEQDGLIHLGHLTLIRRMYKDGHEPIFESVDRAIRVAQKLTRKYGLSSRYYKEHIQDAIFSNLFNKQNLRHRGEEYKYLPYFLAEYKDFKITDIAKVVNMHSVYEPELVYASDKTNIICDDDRKFKVYVVHPNGKKDHRTGMFKFPSFGRTNFELNTFMSDFTNTGGTVKVLKFIDNSMLAQYISPYYMFSSGIRLSLGNHSTIQALKSPTREFDQRIIRPKALPWADINSDIGFYLPMVHLRIADIFGNIPHEGNMLIDRDTIIDFGAGSKLSTDDLNKGTLTPMMGMRVYFIHKGKKIYLNVNNYLDTPKRKNAGSLIGAAFEAGLVYGDNKPEQYDDLITGKLTEDDIGHTAEVFAEYDTGEVESLGMQQILYSYMYLTDKVRGSLSSYTNRLEDIEDKDELSGIRAGQELIYMLIQHGAWEVLDDLYNGLDRHIGGADERHQEYIDKGHWSLYGKHGLVTKEFQPKRVGYHGTVLPNYKTPKDETWVVASRKHLEIILKDMKADESILDEMLDGDSIVICGGYMYRPPRINNHSIRYQKLRVFLMDDIPGYSFPLMYVNSIVWMLMGGDHDGDEGFYTRVFRKEASKELKEHFNPFEVNISGAHYFKDEFTQMYSFTELVDHLEKVSGRKLPEHIRKLQPYSDKELKLQASGLWMSSILSNAGIGYAKGPIMKLESTLIHILFDVNKFNNLGLVEKHLKKLNTIISDLNEFFTQPTISIKKWADKLSDGVVHMILVYFMSKHLRAIVDELLDPHVTKGFSKEDYMVLFVEQTLSFLEKEIYKVVEELAATIKVDEDFYYYFK